MNQIQKNQFAKLLEMHENMKKKIDATNMKFKKEIFKPIEKVFLYVPYEYKSEAKIDGAQWDNFEKKWYVMSDNSNLQTLKEKWDCACFRDSFHGTIRKYFSWKDIERPEEYNEKKHGSYRNYSVNILGHE